MRADKFFAEKFGSRTKAAEAIKKGFVLVNGKTVKAKSEVSETDSITYLQPETAFVSNGGYKLARAIKTFEFSCKDKVFADIGASTGGFTDCLLQNGAKKVYAIDVGESLLHASLQNHPQIVTMENTNARYLRKTDFPEPLNCIVTDVSFISLRLIFPVIKELLGEQGSAFALIKPQFECENQRIGKSGIVTPSAHAKIVEKVLTHLTDSGLYPLGIVNAPIRKGKNIEYVLHISPDKRLSKPSVKIVEEVKTLVKRNSLGELL